MGARKGIFCDTDCWWKWTAKDCSAKRSCVCNACQGLDAINIQAYDSCRLACNSDDASKRPTSPTQYMCQTIGAAEAYGRYGYTCAGFDPVRDTAQGKALTNYNSSVANNRNLIYAFVLLLIIILGILAVRASNIN